MTNFKLLIAFSGDSHTLSMFPMSEYIVDTQNYDVFLHSRSACAFPAQGVTKSKNCYEVQKSIEQKIITEISERDPGSIVVATSNLIGYFAYDGGARGRISKHPDGSRISVDKNLDDFIFAVKDLANILANENASLIVIAPFPQHKSFYLNKCQKQWFKIEPHISCDRSDSKPLIKQRSHIIRSLKFWKHFLKYIQSYWNIPVGINV